MIEAFEYNSLPSRVVFGYDTLKSVVDEAHKLGMHRPLVLTTPGSANKGALIANMFGERCAGLYSKAQMHTPVEITEHALENFFNLKADGTVAIGGGSTIGLGKALALQTDCPQIVIPTTYAGSEMTPYLGQTKAGVKTTLTSMKVLPETVIYDVSLTFSLSAHLSAASGLNAIAHAVEALYARGTNPVVRLIAVEGISTLYRALPQIVADAENKDGRSGALYGAWLCSSVQGQVPTALHHKLCHAIGGAFDLPHADTHANILPHVVAYNSRAAATAIELLGGALEASDPAKALFALNQELKIQTSLQDLGMPEHGIEVIVSETMNKPYWNPRPMNRIAIEKLLRRAWSGEHPQFDDDQ